MMNTSQIIEAFKASMRESGVEPPDCIKADGELHREDIPGRKPGNKHLAYKLHLDGAKPAGYFEDFKTGIKSNWKSGGLVKPLSNAERQQFETAEKQRQEAIDRKHAQAAEEAAARWENASKLAEGHPYLNKKGVLSYGARLERNKLLIPVRINGVITSLQMIAIDGSKQFLPAGKIKAGYFAIGGVILKHVVVVEGFATGASIHQATGHPVAVAFHAGNLEDVARSLRQSHPKANIIIAAE